jgi:hypothetical protein
MHTLTLILLGIHILIFTDIINIQNPIIRQNNILFHFYMQTFVYGFNIKIPKIIIYFKIEYWICNKYVSHIVTK